jgi:hypothetical protein
MLLAVLETQGIFRLSGGAESVRNLKKAFDTSTLPLPTRRVVGRVDTHSRLAAGKDQWNVALPDFTSSGPHAVASLLKLYQIHCLAALCARAILTLRRCVRVCVRDVKVHEGTAGSPGAKRLLQAVPRPSEGAV